MNESFIAQQRLGLKTFAHSSPAGLEAPIPKEVKIILEKLQKLEDMYKTGKVKENVYRKLKTDYEEKLGRLTSKAR